MAAGIVKKQVRWHNTQIVGYVLYSVHKGDVGYCSFTVNHMEIEKHTPTKYEDSLYTLPESTVQNVFLWERMSACPSFKMFITV